MGKLRYFWLFVITALFIQTAAYGQNDNSKDGFEALKRKLVGLANSPGNSNVSISVVDLETGATIFEKNGDELKNPASNVKVITAACALKVLGPEFRFITSLHGNLDGTVIRGPLYFKGHADPTLSTKDLFEIVHSLTSAGVTRIEGGIIVDDSYFDDKNLPFAFEQQSDEDAAFRAPVGAASLNHNTVSITIGPGSSAMTKAKVVVDPPGLGDIVNDSITVATGASNPRLSVLELNNRAKIRVWGQVSLGARPVTYTRRVDHPSFLTGYGLMDALKTSGITVGGDVRTGSLPPGVPMLAEQSSPPLSAILYEAGKLSNNFVAETVLKTMGAKTGKTPATWEAALSKAAEVLEAWGLPKGTYEYKNGSGLFNANRFSANQFTRVLRAAALDNTIKPEFLAQLATGGIDGTIDSRYQKPGERRLVRAKTGTLADVSTLSGYVFEAKGERTIVFSILVNDASGYVSSARTFQETIVSAIAEFLNPGSK